MIAISSGIFNVWTCRILKARAEPGVRALYPLLPPNNHTPPPSIHHPASTAGGGHAPGFSPSLSLFLSYLLPRAPPLEPFLRARSRSEQASGSPDLQTSDSGGERKMEVRVGERLLCLVVLSSVLFVDSVLGKYVKGIVNTKEVSAACFCFTSLICYHLRQ